MRQRSREAEYFEPAFSAPSWLNGSVSVGTTSSESSLIWPILRQKGGPFKGSLAPDEGPTSLDFAEYFEVKWAMSLDRRDFLKKFAVAQAGLMLSSGATVADAPVPNPQPKRTMPFTGQAADVIVMGAGAF